MKKCSTSYAVIFKTHFWDAFVERQFQRLCGRSGDVPVFVVVDETKGRVHGISHEHVIRMTEEVSKAEGYLCYPPGNMFWYNTDYQVYHFFDQYLDFDYVFICEYDCVVNVEVATVIEAMTTERLEFVGERIQTPPETWPWTPYAQPYYVAGLQFQGRLLCCAAFSREFARQLQEARRNHGRRLNAEQLAGTKLQEIICWPNNEAFVGAEIARLRVKEAPLSKFGDISCYDWAPPHPEFGLSALAKCAFIHPVLDNRRYLAAITKHNWKPQDLFLAGSQLQRSMERFDPVKVVPMFLRHFGETADLDALQQLRDYANRRTGTSAASLFNVARGKPATQSSTCKWSRHPDPAQDAAGAVSGETTGSFGFHTNLEEEPWWCVDLKGTFPVSEIRIYNRLDEPDRARFIIVSFSPDLLIWHKLFQHDGSRDFGGANGSPLTIELVNPVHMRFVRVHLPKLGILHLDEVEIYV